MVPSVQQPRYVRRQGVPLSQDLPCIGTREVTLGIGSLPYLADHGFQDMVVLPGSFCIETTLHLHREIFKSSAGIFRNIKFQRPVILSKEETHIRIEARQAATNLVEYLFFEPPDTSPFASIEVNNAETIEKLATKFSIETFKVQGSSLIDTKEFYRALQQNGNQYGPRFQNLSAIWRSDNQALGRLSLSRRDLESQPHHLHPAVLDSVTQLLATFIFEKGRAFALESIDQIEISDSDFLETTLWARAKLPAGTMDEARGFSGDIDVFDEFGNRYLAFGGVSFRYLEGTDPCAKLDVCVTASFTAEPVEAPLKFWADRFGLPATVQFAPYNQIFQQLLDKSSAFHNNDDGFNVILLNLEDWTSGEKNPGLKVDGEKLNRAFANYSRYLLPNGLEIVQLNQYETDYLYQEIFHDECYLRHGIRIDDGDTIVDIGANIGLFSLFVLGRCKNPRIYAFEPSPVVYELLKANCEAYGQTVQTFQCGVSDRSGLAEFTVYDKSSVFSSFHSNATEDRLSIEAVARNILSTEAGKEAREGLIRDLTVGRLRSQIRQCPLISLSEIIRQNQIERIHLLKIDAERSELEIINGIEDAHWPLIDQLVIEIHDRTDGAARQVQQLLAAKGYHCVIEQEKLLADSGLFNIYATRRVQRTDASQTNPLNDVRCRVSTSSDEFCAALDSFASRSKRSTLLCLSPRSPESVSDPALNQVFEEAEAKLLARTNKIPNVHNISSAEILNSFQLRDYYDHHAHHLGHLPYTTEGYVAIGSALFQHIFKLRTRPFKVLVLDCDNTLWRGVCGEDGPLGIELALPYRVLQQFAVKQMNNGRLICLCSKNNEKDVFEVFDQCPEMVLKRDHLASWQINWNNKSDNLKALAAKLNLALDSFIFLDDNPVDCAEVRFNCPEVLTLQLPQQEQKIESFLRGLWFLQTASSTHEDEKRTQMYRENLQREQLRHQSFSLKDFLDGLQLQIEIAPPVESQIARISQLTWRTNQFNLTAIRRSPEELRTWLEKKGHESLVASVSDRFGDYGLVGVLLYEVGATQFTVDTFLLSCRALGRGVEHRILSELAQMAERQGRKFVRVNYVPSERNSPALTFIRTLSDQDVTNRSGPLSLMLSSKLLAKLRYEPDITTGTDSDEPTDPVSQNRLASTANSFTDISRSSIFQSICDELTSIRAITEAVENRWSGDNAPDAVVRPAETLEGALGNLWRRVLGRGQIGINDNFFETGGTSLTAVRLIALIQRELKRSLPLTVLFECPTIKLLAAKLRVPAHDDRPSVGDSRQRGEQRRYKKIKTKRIQEHGVNL
jgi:FkbH-like protein/FkbM family methyltransferase